MSDTTRQRAIECMAEAVQQAVPDGGYYDQAAAYDALIDSDFVVLAPGELEHVGWMHPGQGLMRGRFVCKDCFPIYGVRATAPEQGGQG